MARNPDWSVTFSKLDYSGEPAVFSLHTAAHVDVDTQPVALSEFITALGDISTGLLRKLSSGQSKKITNGASATEGNREERILLEYADNDTLAIYNTEIPCRKSTVLPPQGTDQFNLAVAPWVNFKTKFEALARSPDGNTVTLQAAYLMGKNV